MPRRRTGIRSTVTPWGQLSQLEKLTGVETRRIHVDKAYRGPSLSGFIGEDDIDQTLTPALPVQAVLRLAAPAP
jgi:hypothetical protein